MENFREGLLGVTVFEELKRRGLVAQMTNEEKIKQILENEKCRFYIGFDATADSLHVGHFFLFIVMKRLQQAGHIPIALLGTGTAMVGDPTGRTDMRQMIDKDEIKRNAQRFKEQMSRFVDFSDGRAIFVENGDWLLNLNYIEFLRKVGKYFSVNKMLTAECIKSRMEHGLSFLEFNYMIMQSYDFLRLYQDLNCKIEIGGDDQWSNILGGIDLVRRVERQEVYGLTFTLLKTKEGKKMGKTQKGALWLDENKCSPYEFFQYWRNVDDAEVIKCLKMLTFIPIEEIESMEKWQGSKLNQAKEILAFELTKMVHGELAANDALKTSKSLFSSGTDDENMPTTFLLQDDFDNGRIGVLKLLVLCGLCKSNGEARRLVEQGGVMINGERVVHSKLLLKKSDFECGLTIKKGKKVFHRVKLS